MKIVKTQMILMIIGVYKIQKGFLLEVKMDRAAVGVQIIKNKNKVRILLSKKRRLKR